MYGQYISQFDTRTLATGDQLDELNFDSTETAAKKMCLTYESYQQSSRPNVQQFLAWVKQSIIGGFPVMIGIYMNLSIFGELEDNGTNDYDHIVPVIGVESSHDLKDQTRKWFAVIGPALNDNVSIVNRGALNRRNVERAGQVVDNCVEHVLHTLVLKS